MGESPLRIAPNHPAFGGHFPGHSVVPGVMLLDETLATIAAAEGLASELWRLGLVKFQRPAGPGEPLVLRWVLRWKGLTRGGWELEILTAGQAVATGSTEALGAREAPGP